MPMAKDAARPMLRPTTRSIAGRDDLSMPDGSVRLVMKAIAFPGGRPQVVRLAVEDRGREFAITVDRRALPEEQPLDRQRRVALARVAVLARGIGKLVAGAGDRVDHARVELPAGVGEVRDRFAQARFECLA